MKRAGVLLGKLMALISVKPLGPAAMLAAFCLLAAAQTGCTPSGGVGDVIDAPDDQGNGSDDGGNPGGENPGDDEGSSGDGGDDQGDGADGGDADGGDGTGAARDFFAKVRFVASSSGSSVRRHEGEEVAVEGALTGFAGENVQVAFISEQNEVILADVDGEGRFSARLSAEDEYFMDLLEDGRFAGPMVCEDRAAEGSEGGASSTALTLEYQDGVLLLTDGPIETTGDPIVTEEQEGIEGGEGEDAAGVPIGMAEGLELVGVTDEAMPVEMESEGMDVDLDGIPATFDGDADGDGVLDLVDDEVLVTTPKPTPDATDGATVGGAYVFNNLKLDIDQLVPPPTSRFTHNDSAVVTIGWMENPADTPAGFSVIGVEAVDVPGWDRYGFVTTIGDWSIAPGVAGYVGYPASGTAWTGSLYQSGMTSGLWEVWVQSPKADAALAAAYPLYVEAGKSVPLNFDFSGGGIPSSNKIDFYRLLITYSDGATTLMRFAHASSLFSFRTPGVTGLITTSAASYPVDHGDVNGDGHGANPIPYPDASTLGDITMEVSPPKYDVSATTGIILGTMNWRFDIFYYDAAGVQIGGLLTAETPVTFTGASFNLSVPELLLDPAGARTDMDGDGVDDLQAGRTSADIAAYKIDLTAVALTGGDNTGLFLYFVNESAAGTFAGF